MSKTATYNKKFILLQVIRLLLWQFKGYKQDLQKSKTLFYESISFFV